MGRHVLPGRISARLESLLGDKSTLPGQAARAAGWTLGNTIATRAVTFGINVMLARLLGPHEFGTFAVASVALTIMTNVNDLGVSLAIVRWPGDPREIAPTVTTISVITSAVLYVACYFGAPGYSAAMGAPAATGVVRVLSLVILIDGFATAPIGLLQRNFRADHRTVADQVNVWLGMLLTLALALGGLGAMSLAIGRVVGCLAAVGLLVDLSPEPLRFGFNRREARALLRFGLPLAGADLIAFTINVDQLVVGHALGAVSLGLYVLALNISGWPLTMLSRPVRNVTPAVFARLRHDPAARRTTFLAAAAALAALALPVCAAIAGSAGPLTRFVYGSRWAAAAGPLCWLAVLAAARILFELAYDYLAVLGRSRFVLLLQLGWLLTLVPALAAGTSADGITGAGLAEAAVAVLAILPCYLAGLSRSGISLGALGRRLALPAGAAALAGLAAAAAARLSGSNATAIALSCAVTLVIVASLGYRTRTQLGLLRRFSAARGPQPAAPAPGRAAPRPRGRGPASEPAAQAPGR